MYNNNRNYNRTNDKIIYNDKTTNDNYLKNIIYKINNPRERELALYGKVIFKYSVRDVE